MIEESTKLHDKYQFEIKWSYLLKEASKQKYDTEIFFFVPNSLGISKHTYGKDDFYKDIKNYIRFKTPEIELKELPNYSVFQKLAESFHKLTDAGNKKNLNNYKFQLRMMGCICKSALRNERDFIIKKRKTNEIDFLIEQYVKKCIEVTRKFRDLKKIITSPKVKDSAFTVFLLTDEYISNLIEINTYKILKKMKSNFKFRERLLDLIDKEVEYRTLMKYPTIVKENDDNEEFVFRRSILKKYIESILFLNTRTSKPGMITQQILFGIAAGVAMVFATLVAFQARQHYGNFTLPLLLILVLSYIFKDRIKELLRLFFVKKVRFFHHDFQTEIHTNKHEKMGICTEDFGFLKKNEIPEKIKIIRNRDPLTEIENNWLEEEVILYRKTIKLNKNKITNHFRDYKLDGINDIIRVNMNRFLLKMDDPMKKLFINKNSKAKLVKGTRVYHINVVVKYHTNKEISFKRFRVILQQNGIKRIEKIEIEPNIYNLN